MALLSLSILKCCILIWHTILSIAKMVCSLPLVNNTEICLMNRLYQWYLESQHRAAYKFFYIFISLQRILLTLSFCKLWHSKWLREYNSLINEFNKLASLVISEFFICIFLPPSQIDILILTFKPWICFF